MNLCESKTNTPLPLENLEAQELLKIKNEQLAKTESVAAGREKQRAKWKRWHQANLMEYRIYSRAKVRQWYQAHLLEARIFSRAKSKKCRNKNYPKNKDRINARRRTRYKEDDEHRLRCRLRRKKRRLQEKITSLGDVKHLAKIIAAKKSLKCFYCYKPVSKTNFHFDHIKPLNKGGVHGAYNLVISCPLCNLQKATADANDFIKKGQLILVF